MINVMLEIAEAVRVNAALAETTFHYPVKHITPPGFVLTLPDDWDPTVTYGRGSSSMTLMGWLILPWNDALGATEIAAGIYDPASPTNLVKLIQDRRYTHCAKVMVERIKFEPVMLGDTVYMASRNVLNVLGMGK